MGNDLKRPPAVLFDWDDTLIDNWESIHSALNKTLTAMGHETWTIERTRKQVRQSMRNSFPQLFGDKWETAADIFYDHIKADHLQTLKRLPHAREILVTLNDFGLPVGIVSNKTGYLLRAEVAYLGWDNFFTAIVGAGDAAQDKPEPDPIYLCLNGSGINSNESGWPHVWFVGDAPSDLECANKAGVTSVLLCKKPYPVEEFGDLEPKIHVENLKSLESLFMNLKQSLLN